MLDTSWTTIWGSVALGTLGYAYYRHRQQKSPELYDDADAVLLNLQVPRTRWFNMGFWTATGTDPNDFATAAEELCRRVATAARLQPGERICEVGYGSGDSTLLLASEFRPKSYIGFTSLAAQQRLAARRAAEARLSASEVVLRHGDAARELPTLPAESQDVVLAVDCAYHFRLRDDFLSAANRALVPSGRIALTDLLLPSEPLGLTDYLLLRILFYFANTPWQNFLSPARYRTHLVNAGFDPDSIEMHDISDDVWPGFCRFMRERDRQLGRGAILGSAWRGLLMYTRVVEWYSGVSGGPQRLGFYLISASKSRRSAEMKQ
ncbi:hypothetical protein JCM10908_006704 [Rhodotorula pacifica]|uniref:class I SAM-dependent methyltransferase n=1 Tax=Rhodotorula pacifica TaxID=1495444 RepID=UPI00317A3CA4